MRRAGCKWLSLAMLFAATAASAIPGPESSRALLITNVRIIDTDIGSISEPMDILVRGGHIGAVSPAGALSVPPATRQLDASGRFALPGLIDVHAHVGEGGAAPDDDVSRARALRQFLRYGVTTIFVPGATGAGDSDFSRLRLDCRSVAGSCPRIYGSGSILTAPGSHPVGTIFGMSQDVADEIVEARGVTLIRPDDDLGALIERKAASGVDAIKIVIEDGPPPWYPRPRLSDEAVKSIVREAHTRSLPVVAHVSNAALARTALELGVDAIMHGPVDPIPQSLIEGMADRHMWYVPTFALYDGILTWARKSREADPYALKGVEPAVIESLAAPHFLEAAAEDEATALSYLETGSSNLRRALLGNVPIALGTDVNNPFVYPGFSAHEELALMVKAGLTPHQALRAATLGGADFLGAGDRLGRIAPGFEADFLLLSKDPLDRIENSRTLVAVIADGRVIDHIVSED